MGFSYYVFKFFEKPPLSRDDRVGVESYKLFILYLLYSF